MLTADDLANLPALRKPHPSWPFQPDASGNIPAWQDVELLKQYARITGSIPLSLDYYRPDQVTIVESLDCSVCVTSSPWRSAGPNDFWNLLGRIVKPAQALTPAVVDGAKHVLLDIEMSPPMPLAQFTACYHVLQALFPVAEVIVFGAGAKTWSSSGFVDSLNPPAGTPGPANVPLYFSEWSANQALYRATAQASPGAIPWLALGGCQRRAGQSWAPFAPGMESGQAWIAGFEINHPLAARNADWHPASQAPYALFWRGLNDPALPDQPACFLAYVKGGAGQEI